MADSINDRIQVFDKDGNFRSQFGRSSGGRLPQLGGPSPYGDPLDLSPGVFNWPAGSYYSDDKYYVNDFFQGRVQVLEVVRTEPVPEPSQLLGIGVLGAGFAGSRLLRKQRQSKQRS